MNTQTEATMNKLPQVNLETPMRETSWQTDYLQSDVLSDFHLARQMQMQVNFISQSH